MFIECDIRRLDSNRNEFSFLDLISRVESWFPSEKEVLNIGFLNKCLEITPTKSKIRSAEPIDIAKNNSQGNETDAVMPIVMLAKYIANSKGDLTGFLNLTIDKAPTIPKESAIFPDITFVITNVIIGKISKVAV